MLFSKIIEILTDAAVDTIKILPFLFFAYLFMEYIEEGTSKGSTQLLSRARSSGPFWGAVAGVIPQCGFSASSSGLYSGGVITMGTLIAVFLSTSDEMVPIFLSERVPAATILRILLLKVLIGMISGFVLDAFLRKRKKDHGHVKRIHDLCEHDNCHCGSDSPIWKPALKHTVRIALYIFLFTVVLSGLIAMVGEKRLAGFLSDMPVFGLLLSGLIGLIPNCAASVILTQMYLGGLITTAQMMTGLLVGAGVGLIVLFRTNNDLKENVRIAALLYGLGVFWGLVIEVLKIHI